MRRREGEREKDAACLIARLPFSSLSFRLSSSPHTPPTPPALFRALMDDLLAAAAAALPAFLPHQLSGFLVALSQMGYTPSRAWVAEVQVRV